MASGRLWNSAWAGVFTINAGFFRALAAQHSGIDKAFSADPAVIRFYRRSSPAAGTVRHGEEPSRQSLHACDRQFTIATAALFSSPRRAVRPSTRDFPGRPPPFPVRGLWVRRSESSSRGHTSLDLALLFSVRRRSFHFLHLRCAKRDRLPDVPSLSHYFI